MTDVVYFFKRNHSGDETVCNESLLELVNNNSKTSLLLNICGIIKDYGPDPNSSTVKFHVFTDAGAFWVFIFFK